MLLLENKTRMKTFLRSVAQKNNVWKYGHLCFYTSKDQVNCALDAHGIWNLQRKISAIYLKNHVRLPSVTV